MKNKEPKTKLAALGAAGHLLSRTLCLGAVILTCSSALAQNLFVSDGLLPGSYHGVPYGGRLYQITPDGAPRTFASGLAGPTGLAFDSAGNLFVAAYGSGAIYKFTPKGVRSTFAIGLGSPGSSGPMDLAFDNAGNLFVAVDDSSSRTATVYKFTPDGVRSTFAIGLGDGLDHNHLASDSAGNLFVTAFANPRGIIYKFTPDGVRTTFASALADQLEPGGLAFDSVGNLFVTDGPAIYKFTPDGMRSTFASGLAASAGLAFDNAGDLFVLDYGGGGLDELDLGFSIIYKFTPDGVRSTFVASIESADADFLAFQPADTFQPAQLLNISTRLMVLTDDDVLIGGFIISGSDNKQVLLRALGPSLDQSGVRGGLADPTLELHDGAGAVIASNDNWKETQEAEISATGLAPSNDLESGILRTLAPGNYTVIVHGKNATSGVALVEAYDLAQAANASLSNISTRGFVGIDDNVMIGGFISGIGNCKVIVRALGPTLAQSNVPNVLADPMLELHDANGTLIASNDNWQDTQQAEIQASGLAPLNPAESAIITTRPAGTTTAIVRGKNNTIGNALIEVYKIP